MITKTKKKQIMWGLIDSEGYLAYEGIYRTREEARIWKKASDRVVKVEIKIIKEKKC
jgi:hypothetical protein